MGNAPDPETKRGLSEESELTNCCNGEVDSEAPSPVAVCEKAADKGPNSVGNTCKQSKNAIVLSIFLKRDLVRHNYSSRNIDARHR